MKTHKVTTRDLTSGGIIKNLLRVALPMIIAMIVETGYNIIDTIFVGKLGPEAIAAVTLVFPVAFVMIAIAAGIGTGTNALIANYIGAGKRKEADNVAEHSILLALFLGIIITTIGLATVTSLFSALGASEKVLKLVTEYVSVIYSGSSIMFLGIMANGMLKGLGETKTIMKAMITGAIANTLLDPLLIFHFEMGIRGAAIATVISRTIVASLLYLRILSRKTSLSLSARDFSFNPSIIKKLFFIGVPSSIGQVSMALGWAALGKMASYFGHVSIAALGIGFRVDAVAIFPVLGLGIAVLTLVGQNIGAKKTERARKTTLAALRLSSGFMLFLSALFYTFAAFIAELFSSNTEVVSLTTSYIRTVAPTYLFVAVTITIGFAILGTGNAVPHMILTLTRVLIFSLPAAYLLSFPLSMGTKGIFTGIAFAAVLSGLMSFAWFKRMDWKSPAHLTH